MSLTGSLARTAAVVLLAAATVLNAQGTATTAGGVAATATSNLSELERAVESGGAEKVLPELTQMAAAAVPMPGVLRVRGAALYALNRFPEADEAFRAALAQDPKDGAAMQLRGLTLFRLGRPADAIPLLEKAHTWTDETRVDPNYVLALCYLDTRRYDDSRRAFAAQYGFAPEGAPAHLLMARMLLRREYVPIAQQEARKALELEPGLPLAHLLLGEVALAGEHLDEATAEFEQEAQRNPLYGGVYDRLGDAYTRKGDFPRAQQALEKALVLEPTSTGPYILLGKVLLKRQDPVSATGYLERAERMDPANYMTHHLLGQAYRSVGRTEEARREAELAQRLQAESAPKLDTPKHD